MNRKSFYCRYGVTLLVVAAALIPIIAWGGIQAIVGNSNDVRDWLPSKYLETQEYRWFTDHFGQQDFIVVSWPDCTQQDQRLDEFARQLNKHADAAPSQFTLGRVFTGRSLLQQLMAPPVNLDETVAMKRLRGVVIGPDGHQSCAMFLLPKGSAPRLESTIKRILQAAESARIPRDEVRMGGIPILNAAINRESTNSLMGLAAVSGLLGLVMSWICFQDLRMTTMILAVGVYGAAASLAIVPFVGIRMNAILITMVPLVYVTAVSGAIHLSNYYLDTLKHSSPLEAPGIAMAHAALPLILAATTTMLGLFSLGYSDLAPIQMFGVFSAVGVAIASIGVFLLLPAAMVVWRPRTNRPAIQDIELTVFEHSESGIWSNLAGWVVRNWGGVLFLCLFTAGVCAAGLPRIRTSIQIMRLFSPGAPVIPMTRWMEERLGATIPLEVIVRFHPESETSALDRMLLVSEIHSKLGRLPGASGCLSAATFSPQGIDQLENLGTGRLVRRSIINNRLRNCLGLLRENGWIVQEGEEESWRISLRIRGIDDLDDSELLKNVREILNPIRDADLEVERAGVDVVVTGTAPIVFKARQSLLNGLVWGLGTDVLLIVAGVMLLTRSLLTGAIVFLVSIFPTVLVFGLMGWLGIVVDIGSVMTPCVAMGVTVDDVIHFLLCHHRSVHERRSSPRATIAAYNTCGRAIVQSWGIIGIGLAPFALSSFVPTFRFGLLMLVLLTAGMLGNLLFLPSLLAGPLGRWAVKMPKLAKPPNT